jgi:hypothetical protein
MIYPPKSLSLRVIELENAVCNQDKLFCKIFHENKKLNLELESASSKITTLRSMHDDMSAKSCDNYKMIMVNYADLWLVHSHVASLLDGAILELRELKLIPHYLVLAPLVPCLDLILTLLSLRLKILSINLIILLATLFYLHHVKHVSLSRINFSMLPKRTLSYNRRLLI